MAGYGWLIAGGLGILAVAAISSGGSSGGAKVATTPDPTKRFTIKRDVLTPGMELSLSDFKVGDVIGVTVQDSKLKIEYPILVKVMNALKDGLDTLYTPAVTMADGPPEMHFLVLPRDVISPMKKFGDGSALFNHTMTAADVLMGPVTFATTYGFGGADAVKAMLLANPKVGSTGFEDRPATAADFATPGFYTTTGAGVGFTENGIVSPWIMGQDVLVKRNPIIIAPISFAGEASPGFGEVGFGGDGFGGTSIGKDFGGGVAVVDSHDDYTRGYGLGVNAVVQARANPMLNYSETITGLAPLHQGFVAGVKASGGHVSPDLAWPTGGAEIVLTPTSPNVAKTVVNARGQKIATALNSNEPITASFLPAPWTQTYFVAMYEAATIDSTFPRPLARTWGRRPVRAY